MKKTKIKIICTLGPSTLNKKFLKFANKNNVDLLRLNMSHLSTSNLEKSIKFIKKNSSIPICIDTEGAQIRTKVSKSRFIKLGQIIIIGKSKNSFSLYPEYINERIRVNDILNIVPEVIEPTNIATVETQIAVPEDKDAEVDFDTGRENLYKMLEKGNDAIDGILALAKEGEHPRAYEVAGQLIKTVADVSKDLMAMQEKLKKLKEVPNTGPKSVTNALFVGSTTELTKLLKEKK